MVKERGRKEENAWLIVALLSDGFTSTYYGLVSIEGYCFAEICEDGKKKGKCQFTSVPKNH